MKRILIVALLLGALASAFWCWSFGLYRVSVMKVRTADMNGDITRMASIMEEAHDTVQMRVLTEIPFFSRRLEAIRAHIAGIRGDEIASAEAFSGVIVGDDDQLSARAHYNRGNLQLARAQLEAAQESYIRALRIDPDDIQAKINLELTQQEIERQQAGRKEGDLAGMRKALMDYWLRDGDTGSAGDESKRIWR